MMMKFVTFSSLATADALQLKGGDVSSLLLPKGRKNVSRLPKMFGNKEKICPCCLTTVVAFVDADPNEKLGLVFNNSTHRWYDATKPELTVMHLAEGHQKCFKNNDVVGLQLLTVNGQKVERSEDATKALEQVKNTLAGEEYKCQNVTLEFGKRGVTGNKLWFDEDKKNHRVCQECYDKNRKITGRKSKGLFSRKFPIATCVASFLGSFLGLLVLAVGLLGCVIAGPYILAGALGGSALVMLVTGLWAGFSALNALFFIPIYIGTRERK